MNKVVLKTSSFNRNFWIVKDAMYSGRVVANETSDSEWKTNVFTSDSCRLKRFLPISTWLSVVMNALPHWFVKNSWFLNNILTCKSAFSAAASRSLAISWRRLWVSCSKEEMSTSLLSSSRRSGREGRPAKSSAVPWSFAVWLSTEPLLSVWPFLAAEGGTLLIHSGPHTRQSGSVFVDSNSHMALSNDHAVLRSRPTIFRWFFSNSRILSKRTRFSQTAPEAPTPSDPFSPFCGHATSEPPPYSSAFWNNKTLSWEMEMQPLLPV